MPHSYESELKSVDLFSHLDNAVTASVAAMSQTIDIEEGSHVFRRGDKARHLYIVVSGEIVIQETDDAGNSTDIARFLPGDCFGELDLFTGKQRSADALVLAASRLLEFPKSGISLDDVADSRPEVGAQLYHGFLSRVSSRIRGVNAMVKENSPLVRELKRQIYVDKLTGLFNRTFFEETLTRTLSETDTTGLLIYKPDNFKLINDARGHETGDKTLKFIADSLREFVPNPDMLFRVTGNENALILPDCGREDLRDFAGRIGAFLRGLELSPVVPDAEFRLSVSIGLALAPEHASEASSLIDCAHQLTMEGRRLGGNRCFFPEDLQAS